MSKQGVLLAVALTLIVVASCSLLSNESARSLTVKGPVGIDQRIPWTSSRVQGTPDPPTPYRTRPAFGDLQFAEPLAIAAIPGTNRLAVLERAGTVRMFRDDPAGGPATVLLDLGRTAPGPAGGVGLAFHPQFQSNGYVYVTYVLDALKEEPRGTRVSRFTVQREGTWRADTSSEKVILEWPSGGHNGGCLRFGPDGFLYIATGDGSGIADERHTGQDVSDLLGALLRIDVDHPPAGKAYGIPEDNPFRQVKDARPEIWAYGLRNPWKFSFDRMTDDLWLADVGQDLWEMIYRIQRGGNYGWSVTEGTHPFRPQRKKGPTPILRPILEQNHTEFRSITGGYVYHGRRLRELVGTYVYGDYDTGKVWALSYDGQRVTENIELVDTTLRIIAFAQTRDGEIYLLDHVGGKLHQLVRASGRAAARPFPRKLSETGLFASVKDHEPAPGVIPYTVNAALWADGAEKDRFLAVPGDAKIEFDTMTYPQPAPGAPPGWKFPDGTVLVKTFSLEMEVGNPASRRRLETRLLHHERLAGDEVIGDQYWRGYTYLWNDDQTDATLLEDPNGLDRTFTVIDRDAPGGTRQQTWHFPSRAECTLCHTQAAKFVLGVNTLQMNKDHDYGGVVANQLRTLEHIGLFTEPLPDRPERLGDLADYTDPAESLDRRARAYLHANCAHCHRKWGGGNAAFQLLATQALDDMGIVNVPPGQGRFDVPEARLLVPGDPDRSLIAVRMAKLGLGRMPHIASTVVDKDAVNLVRDWIRQLSHGK